MRRVSGRGIRALVLSGEARQLPRCEAIDAVELRLKAEG
jgi:hypothetical protein